MFNQTQERDKALSEMLNDIGMNTETREATREFIEQHLEAQPDEDWGYLKVMAATFADGYDKALEKHGLVS